MITKRPWFGPKRYFGWGWTPISWQGWLVSALFLVAAITCRVHFGTGPAGILAVVVCLFVYLGIIVLTGTKPGGPNANGGSQE
jgi:hypothetical protein